MDFNELGRKDRTPFTPDTKLGFLHSKVCSVSIAASVGDIPVFCLDIKQEFFIFHFSMFHIKV